MKTTQYGTPIIVIQLVVLFFNAYQASVNFDRMKGMLIVSTIVVIFVGLLFYKLDITIDSERILIRFGIGVIRKSIPLGNIASARSVKNEPWAGWGIRYNSRYTLFNVSGLQAVELSMKDRSQDIRIGTNDPKKIVTYLSDLLGKQAA